MERKGMRKGGREVGRGWKRGREGERGRDRVEGKGKEKQEGGVNCSMMLWLK